MTRTAQEERERLFIEEMGLFYESFGVPRMSGKLLGHLLICEPPVQSSAQIIEALGASKGSVSTSTRMLIRMNLIDKVAVPGTRGSFFRISPNAWTEALESKVTAISMFRRVMDHGLEVLADSEPERRQRLLEARELYAYFETEFPNLIERWKASREDQ